ncbi:hypothetical protein ACFXPU_07400, partial [Streptomyces cyaneofuscatus]
VRAPRGGGGAGGGGATRGGRRPAPPPAPPPRPPPRAGPPDGFRYRITVGDRTVYCADPDLTGAQRTLVSRVLKEGA